MTLTLNKLPHFNGRQGPLLLMILDGVGIGRAYEGNAFYMAHTPVLDELMQGALVAQLKAHGPAVGLPSEDDMGNSEVGHNAIGAGRVFAQGAKLVGLSIQSGDIFKTQVWSTIIERGRAGGAVHFIGLLSDGNVHSHIDQLYALINECAEQGIERVRVHALLDGRDVGEKSALDYIRPTQELLDRISAAKNYDYVIASGGGRMVTTMDRYEADWTIVERGWNTHVHGIGRGFQSAAQAVQTLYDEDAKITDQYLGQFVIVDENGPVGKIEDGDCVINFNFRGDRAIEISRAFTEDSFDKFDRGAVPDVFYAGMMEYDGDLHIPSNYLVNPPAIDRTLSEYLCGCGVKMFAISETQKFGHVTYFWNGNRSGYIDKTLETYVEIPSDKIAFDRAPKMKAMEITDKTIELLRSGHYRFGRLNFANGDMVGHTGVMEAAIVAMETVDACVGRLLKVVEELDGIAIITADHGNLDEMWTEKNGVRSAKTAHTLNPVPFIIVDKNYGGEYKMAQLDDPGLANIAATVFNLLGFDNAADYNASLITFA
ncbi:2,3-bisphosphoglycerate-independent phosphoglycerate mutase [candidate division KSB1 bacterium]|nr:2,3-bisphosphoglycerate-independent phosphoglycerate mutase [candidate division KSB1 bacterium]RQW08121.1 MAG: 2,3-bisphosphoglycerate-independent phosphoglycerate mutase [candidate division KSB1 bacterium]